MKHQQYNIRVRRFTGIRRSAETETVVGFQVKMLNYLVMEACFKC